MSAVDWHAALAAPDDLRARGLFVAEGRRVVARILDGAAGGAGAIEAVLAAPAAVEALDLRRLVGDRLTIASPREMEALTGFNFHRGVLAIVRRPPAVDVRTAVQAGRRLPVAGCRSPTLVVAEHLVDVDNVGSCFRNAQAFGAAAVLLDERCPDPLYRKAVRTSLGAVLDVPWVQAPIDAILDAMADAGVVTIGLTPATSSPRPLADVARGVGGATPVALLVGSEGSGLSAATMRRCTYLASIPMAPGADSLNVATALAVALYEITALR